MVQERAPDFEALAGRGRRSGEHSPLSPLWGSCSMGKPVLHIVAVAEDNAPARDTDTLRARVSVNRRLIDAALGEMQVECKGRLGSNVA